MLSHRGKGRNFSHNLRLAVLLSFVGGLVNVSGFLALRLMTTNVTGYLSLFVQEVLTLQWMSILKAALLLFSFFLGAFFSHVILQLQKVIWNKIFFTIPLILEAIILMVVAFLSVDVIQAYPLRIAYVLLFSMGLQNSLVTFISRAVIRTTHVTGIATDLGIEFAKLLFYFKKAEVRRVLFSHIGLKLAIITSFGVGGLFSALTFDLLHLKTLYIASIVILFTSIYDYLLIQMMRVFEGGKKKVEWSRKNNPFKDLKIYHIPTRKDK